MVNLLATFLALGLLPFTQSRKWRDSGAGTIVLEEAWTIPELLFQTPDNIAPLGGTNAELKSDLVDVHNQRLRFMNENNIDYVSEAEQWAVTVNNRLAESIANNTERFGGFASLSMHNATNAALELKRTVEELGFLGVLLNDYQQAGPDNATLLYYDQPEFDVFWQMVSDLDVPVYLHPRNNIPEIFNLSYGHAPWLAGPGQEYTVTLSNHILGLCTNGILDRFPKVKIIVGHLGERIPSDFVRINEQLLRELPFGMPMKRNASDYWQTNIWEATSGNFGTDLLQFHMKTIGLDRIMYSVDYPFVAITEGEAWVETLHEILTQKELASLKRDVAIKLLKLDGA